MSKTTSVQSATNSAYSQGRVNTEFVSLICVVINLMISQRAAF